MKTVRNPKDLEELRNQLVLERNKTPIHVSVCCGTGCRAFGAAKVADALEHEIDTRGLSKVAAVRRTGCHGYCEHGPVVVMEPSGTAYFRPSVSSAPTIVEKSIEHLGVVAELLHQDPVTKERVRSIGEVPFYKHQNRVLLDANIQINADSIDDYIAIGGYAALAKALTQMTPRQVIDEVKKANLRGRGGGGFPAGVKWETTAQADGEPKYVIVNADEGDPGAYMDRSLLEGNPHSIIEGLMIGAYAIGSTEGFIYVRQEYPLACKHAQIAIDQARELGLLGNNILGTGFSFDITIHRGAGAFVSGESSALISAIEGKVGEPRPKYVHMSQKGLWGKPTCLNNVETWANVPLIIGKGAKWFASMGTDNSKGTKIFSLVGKVRNTGLVEVSMGITLRDIVFKIGGGIPRNKKFKAVQTGGPSGGVIPESMLDLPVDFDRLYEAGSMMGSGGMIVMDEETCMVDTARYYVNFLANESCGKCVPCREGLRQMLKILDRITAGQGREEDLDLLEELSSFMETASLCALGRTASSPVRSTIRHFREEYLRHIRDKVCPAGVCCALIDFQIDQEVCDDCGACVRVCPTHAIKENSEARLEVVRQDCIKCGACYTACPDKKQAVKKVPTVTLARDSKTPRGEAARKEPSAWNS